MARNMSSELIKQIFTDEDTGSLEKCLSAIKPKVDNTFKSTFTEMKNAKNKITELAELHHNTVQKPADQAGEKEVNPSKAKKTIWGLTHDKPQKGPRDYAKTIPGTGAGE